MANPGNQPASALESREVAEAARETEWSQRSFARGIWDGRLSLDLIHPHPAPDPEEQQRAQGFLTRLEAFVEQNVDGDANDRNGWVPQEVLDGLAELGAFGIKIPREYGGLGLSQLSYNRALMIVSSRCSASGAFLSAHQSIGVPQPLVYFGTEEQKRAYLPRLAAGAISAFALTEPEVGSDPANMSTTAELTEDGDAWILNGEKLWCTNGPRSEIMVVMARTPARDGVKGKRPITAFIVETAWEGVEIDHVCEFMGLKAISNGVVTFKDVRVPKENVLWGEGKGLKLALITLNTGRLSLPAFCLAATKGALAMCRDWASQRVQWGAPVGRHDAIAQKIGKMAADTFAMEAVVELTSIMADRKRFDIRLEAAIAKLWHSETGWDTIDEALQVRGGRGYETADSLRARGETPYPIERAFRDMRINLIFEGSSEIMRLFIAREAVDAHLSVAGALVDPRAPLDARLSGLVKAGLHYAWWYPTRWLGWGRWPRYGEFGPLAGHLRFADRMSRKLARALFYAMIRFGAGLERRQAVLGRIVDIGADLFVLTAACVRAQMLRRENPADLTPVELADLFARHARRRIRQNFRTIFANDDVATYRTAKRVLEGRYGWLEAGVLDFSDGAAPGTGSATPEVAQPEPAEHATAGGPA
jgi:alkylation response protein AidB-like acyl-CoA dehydrogenase